MHMSDSLLSPTVATTFGVISGALIVYSAKKLSADSRHYERLPLMGIMGAFIFCAQMINFAIPGTGSSGHIGGGVLLTLLLGPYSAILVMGSVLVVQCLLFADGGLMALGCNIFNLAFWPCLIGLGCQSLDMKRREKVQGSKLFCIFAVVMALQFGAAGVALETYFSGRSDLPLGEFLMVMLLIHLPIAIIEGILTAIVIELTTHYAKERSIVLLEKVDTWKRTRLAVIFLVTGLLFGGVGVWFASSNPDGLEWSISKVSGSQGADEQVRNSSSILQKVQNITALMPEYRYPDQDTVSGNEEVDSPWPKVNSEKTLAGIIGGLVTAALALVIGLVLSAIRKNAKFESNEL